MPVVAAGGPNAAYLDPGAPGHPWARLDGLAYAEGVIEVFNIPAGSALAQSKCP